MGGVRTSWALGYGMGPRELVWVGVPNARVGRSHLWRDWLEFGPGTSGVQRRKGMEPGIQKVKRGRQEDGIKCWSIA